MDPDGRWFGKFRANVNAFFTGGTVVEGNSGNWYVSHADGGYRNFGQSGFRGKADLSGIKTSFIVGDIIMTGSFDIAPSFSGSGRGGFLNYANGFLQGWGGMNEFRKVLEWEYLSQARFNRALSGNFSQPIKHSLRAITKVGQRISIAGAGVSGIEFFTTENKTWGSYGKFGVGLLSAGLTYFPEPITTGIGMGIGAIDLFGGFNGFYQTLDINQNLYNSAGLLMLPSNLHGFTIIRVK